MKWFCLFIMSFVLGCSTTQAKSTDNYPDEWWASIPEGEIASWEIPPQAADRSKGEVILSKRTELGVFSNWAATPISLDGKTYASLEGFWQMMKYPESADDPRAQEANVEWKYTRDQVAQMIGSEAKKAGDLANENMKKMKIDWLTYQGHRMAYKSTGADEHYALIYRASKAKVEQNPQVKALLLKTGNLKFLPDHQQTMDATAAYRNFEIYMKIRQGVF